jgi:hypothetical protein
MLKRFAAFLFILALTGPVWAGVCFCLGGEEDAHAKMSCCKREKVEATSVSASACCDTPCGENGGSKMPRSQTDSSVKIPAPVLAAVEKFINSLNRRPNYAAPRPVPKRAGDAPLQLSHPPNLYLQNHAFLI